MEEMSQAGKASVNLVVSSTGLGAAKALYELFGTPYVVGTPIGENYQEEIRKYLLSEGMLESTRAFWKSFLPEKEIAVIGEAVTALSLAQAIEMTYKKGVKMIFATECDRAFLREGDVYAPDEEDVTEALQGIKLVIADPLYKPVCPEGAGFIPLPAECFSGRIYREEIPNLITGFEEYFKEVLS